MGSTRLENGDPATARIRDPDGTIGSDFQSISNTTWPKRGKFLPRTDGTIGSHIIDTHQARACI
jgi:hypothetical protein